MHSCTPPFTSGVLIIYLVYNSLASMVVCTVIDNYINVFHWTVNMFHQVMKFQHSTIDSETVENFSKFITACTYTMFTNESLLFNYWLFQVVFHQSLVFLQRSLPKAQFALYSRFDVHSFHSWRDISLKQAFITLLATFFAFFVYQLLIY